MKKTLCTTFMMLPLISIAACSGHEENGGDKKQAATAVEQHAAENGKEHAEVHWGYEGAGAPQNWGNLKEEFATCKTGQKQSPIDIVTTKANKGDLPVIEFSYKDAPLSIMNNGHTIQVDYPAGSSIKVGDATYELLQFHFHTPSEHTVDGKPFAMVAHLVHKSIDGSLGVVGVLMEEGDSNPALELLWKVMPKTAGEKVDSSEISINASALLPEDRSYYNYSGSLTTPPCSEGVNWMVLKNPVQVSSEQVAALAALFGNNARPVQELHDRAVTAN